MWREYLTALGKIIAPNKHHLPLQTLPETVGFFSEL